MVMSAAQLLAMLTSEGVAIAAAGDGLYALTGA